jgi:hypothetical protein
MNKVPAVWPKPELLTCPVNGFPWLAAVLRFPWPSDRLFVDPRVDQGLRVSSFYGIFSNSPHIFLLLTYGRRTVE